MKKLFATVSAVALSLAIVAMPAVAASADEAVTPEAVTTETVTTETAPAETTIPEVTVPETTTPETTTPETTIPESTETTETTTPVETSALRATTNEVKENNQPDDHCAETGDGWQPKVEDGGEDVFSVVIPAGTTVIAYCVKAGNTGASEPHIVTLAQPFVGDGVAELVIDHPDVNSVSHYQLKTIPTEPDCDDLTGARGFSVATVEECPEEDPDVLVLRDFANQECTGLTGDLVDGSITLTLINKDGIESISYSVGGGTPTNVPITGSGILIENLDPATYDFVVVGKAGYDLLTPTFSVTIAENHDPDCKKVTICHWNEGGQGEQGSFNIIEVSKQSIVNPNGHATHELDVIPPFTYQGGSFEGQNYGLGEGCGELPTRGPLVPGVDYTDPTCTADGSFTLTSPEPQEGLPEKTVTWYVNDVETEQGTYKAVAGDKVTIRVVATVGYTFETDKFVTEITYPQHVFSANKSCDLTTLSLPTLALTGSDPSPALALTAFLGLLGAVLVRASKRMNRASQEV